MWSKMILLNSELKKFILGLTLLFFIVNLNACIIAIHESKYKLPVENGYNFKCDKKNKFGSYTECREDYIARRQAQRDRYISSQAELPKQE
jgi:hypothetical protein